MLFFWQNEMWYDMKYKYGCHIGLYYKFFFDSDFPLHSLDMVYEVSGKSRIRLVSNNHTRSTLYVWTSWFFTYLIDYVIAVSANTMLDIA